YGFAESVARSAVEKQPNQVPPLAALVDVLQAIGKTKEAREAYQKLAPLARSADPDTPVFRRLAPLVDAWKADKGGSAPPDPAPGRRRRAAEWGRPRHLRPLGGVPLPRRAVCRDRHDGRDLEPRRPQGEERRRPVLPGR